MRRLTLVAVLLATAGCHHGSPAAPTPASTTSSQSTSPQPSTVALIGTVTAMSGDPVTGAKLTILDGPYAGRLTTSADDGDYRFENLMPGNVNVSAIADGFLEHRSGVFVNGTNTLKFTLEFAAACFEKSGVGPATFPLPAVVTRVKILATCPGQPQPFIVHIRGHKVVDRVVGDCEDPTEPIEVYDDTIITGENAGANSDKVEIIESNGVAWTVAEDSKQCAPAPANRSRRSTARARH